MKILKSLSKEDFKEKFGTKEQCLIYLSNEKWGDFYTCIKCEKTKYCEGRKPFNRRCRKCGYDESATANTLFHKVKFGIDKAFEMAYDISTSKKGGKYAVFTQKGVYDNLDPVFLLKMAFRRKL